MNITNEDYTILLVDDEENILRSLKRQLAELEYGIEMAPSGTQGLAVLDAREIAVIISDQRMPGMNGTEFLYMAKEKQPDAIRMLLTAYSDLKDTVDAINYGEINKYLSKPWDEGILKRTVVEAVERYALIKENKRLSQELSAWNTQLEQRVQEQTRDIQRNNQELQVLHENLEKNFHNSLKAFSGLIELCARQKSNHANMVAELSVRMAEALGVAEQEIATVRAGALLHDIGKIGISEAVLKKNSGGFTFDERKEYEQHPVRGQAAVDPIDCLRDAGVLIRHHHEWFNGAGYPDGIGGAEIPLGARIIAVADAIDGHANPGPRGGLYDFAGAMMAIGRHGGIKYDASVILAAGSAVAAIEKSFCCVMDTQENQCPPGDLLPGMRLSRYVRTGTGLFFMSAGDRTDRGKHQHAAPHAGNRSFTPKSFCMHNKKIMERAMKTKCILVVDDDPNVLRAMVRLFLDEDYSVITADSAHAAQAVIEKEPVQLVISDAMMPGMSGHELLAWVRKKHPQIIRTLFTGKADVKTVMKAVNEGEIYRFFTKPWDPDELKLSIKLGLEKYDLEEERRLLLRTVQIQRNELTRIEQEYPGIGAVKRDFSDAILIDEMSKGEIEEIKNWCKSQVG